MSPSLQHTQIMSQFFVSRSSQPNPHSEMELNIAHERLRQARLSFNLALVNTAVSACIGLIGAGLLLSGKLTEGTVTAAGGLASSACCIQFCKDANDRLDKILEELND